MCKVKRFISLCFAIIIIYGISSMPSVHAISGSWVRTDDGKQYVFDDGSFYTDTMKQIGGKWYYFDEDGYMVTSRIITYKEKTYYFGKTGVRSTGWIVLSDGKHYFSKTGTMAVGSMKIGKDEYFFNENGVMQINFWNNGKYYGSDGKYDASAIDPLNLAVFVNDEKITGKTITIEKKTAPKIEVTADVDITVSYKTEDTKTALVVRGYSSKTKQGDRSIYSEYDKIKGFNLGTTKLIITATSKDDVNASQSIEYTVQVVEHVHSFGEPETYPATCTEMGAVVSACSGCNECEIELFSAKHTWDEGVVTLEPTIDEEGVKTFTCTVCEESFTESIPKLKNEHTHEYSILSSTEPTCTEMGYTTYSCLCGASYKDDYVSENGHKIKIINRKEGSCTEGGYSGDQYCSVCDTVVKSGYSYDGYGHSWNEGEISVPATIESPGEKIYICNDCGEIRKEEIPILIANCQLKKGSDICIQLKKLAGNENPTYTSEDMLITGFKRSEELPDMTMSSSNIISSDKYATPAYAWYEDGIIYWYSEDPNPELPADCSFMFCYMMNLQDISGLEYFNTSNVTNLNNMFYNDVRLVNYYPIAGWDVSNVTEMQATFCRYYEDEDKDFILTDLGFLKNWNVSNVKHIDNLFMGLQYVTDLSPIADWDVSNVETMTWTFNHLHSLTTTKDLAKWNTKSLKDCQCAFQHLHSVTDLAGLANWDMSNVWNMQGMFRSNTKLNDLTPLAKWDVSNVRFMGGQEYAYGMFSYDYALTSLHGLENWDVSNVEQMGSMFMFTPITDVDPLANWNVSSLKDAYEMFINCTQLTNLNGLADWNTSNLEYAGHMFTRCKALTELDALSKWNVTKLADNTKMFKECVLLSDISGIKDWKLSSSDNFYEMFTGCTSLKDVSAISCWDISNVVTFGGIFTKCTNLEVYPEWDGTFVDGAFHKTDENREVKDLSTCTLKRLHNYHGSYSYNYFQLKDGDYTLVKDVDYTMNIIEIENEKEPFDYIYISATGKGAYRGTVFTMYHSKYVDY